MEIHVEIYLISVSSSVATFGKYVGVGTSGWDLGSNALLVEEEIGAPINFLAARAPNISENTWGDGEVILSAIVDAAML